MRRGRVHMNILVFNAGSSTLKFKVFDIENEKELVGGRYERIGIDGYFLCWSRGKMICEENITITNHVDAIKHVTKFLFNSDDVVKDIFSSIKGIGHRIAHGGDKFVEPTMITESFISDMDECNELAPLHNSAALEIIKQSRETFKSIPMVAVFDTAFHQTLPKKAYLYGIPYELYTQYKIRKYGFHGTSHKYAVVKAIEKLGLQIDKSKIVVCHLGNGSSISAILNGCSVDTSMGFTPLEGLIMGTRSGDIDPTIVGYLAKKMKVSHECIINLLNKESGLKGISQLSSDFRELLSNMNTNEQAKLAIEMYIYRIIKYIGSYIAVMKGLDVLVFTGGIAENSHYVLESICNNFRYLNVDVVCDIDSKSDECQVISTGKSNIKVVIVKANEELMIAKETYDVIMRKKSLGEGTYV